MITNYSYASLTLLILFVLNNPSSCALSANTFMPDTTIHRMSNITFLEVHYKDPEARFAPRGIVGNSVEDIALFRNTLRNGVGNTII